MNIIEKKGSFTYWVKDESINNLNDKNEFYVFVYVIFKLNGKIINDNSFKVSSLNLIILEKVKNILDFLELKYKIIKLKRSFNLTFNYEDIKFVLEKKFNFNSLNSIEKRAFVSSCFLSKGWINSPISKYYHLEIWIDNKEILFNLKKILEEFNIFFKVSKKNNRNLLYIKKSSMISDFLKIINSSQTLLYFEDERIVRDMISNINKINSIEEYNEKKIKESSDRQLESYFFIIENNLENNLTNNQKKIIKLKLQNKNLSLNDLTYMFNKLNKTNYSKSTINNWLKKIEDISKNNKNE